MPSNVLFKLVFDLHLLLLLSSFLRGSVVQGNPLQKRSHGDPGNNQTPSPVTLTTDVPKPSSQHDSSKEDDDSNQLLPQKTENFCAFYDDHPTAKADNSIELSKRVYKAESASKKDTGSGMPSPAYDYIRVPCKDYCFTLWVANPRNKSQVTVSKQGCWLISEGQECQADQCVSDSPPRQNNTHFCCCSGPMCNLKFIDMYNPAEHTTSSTTTTHHAPVAVGPLHDGSYRKKTIVIALVSVASVALVILFAYLTFAYLTYRLCMNLKPSSPQSSVARVEADCEPALPEFNVEDLKVGEVIVKGRYSEVRKGLLGTQEVAVKIYQPHHRQYYYNERNAFSQPFISHENVVKFFGAKEQEDSVSSLMQYLIVTEYIPLGSLTGYLKHNTIDWYTLCHMCQGISRGLAHLHTDIQKGGLFKPAIAHRDMNTRNILVNPDLSCVLADFGFSVAMIGSKIIKNGVAESAEQASLADVGTLRYMAPEVFDGAVNLRDCEASLKQIDIYALGLIMWEISSRCVDLYQGTPVPDYQLPFQVEGGAHPTFEEMQVLVVKHKTRPKFPEVWKETNPAVRSLKETIEDCWDSDAEARLTSLCVQERITDMTALWLQGTKHRGVTPTLNSTMNLPDGNSHSHNSGNAIVSNGVTYLPSYIDRDNGASGNRVDSSQAAVELNSPVIASNMRRRVEDDVAPAFEDRETVMVPLISNMAQLTTSSSVDSGEGRVRSWLRDQSMSGSTMDTVLPPTPSMEEEDRNMPSHNPHHVSQPPVKANNVMLAKNKAVILHPNQGRNPTVERNTHKRSDEELTVSGNRLVGPGDHVPVSDAGTNAHNRRGSLGTQSAPLGRQGEGSSFDGIDAIESSSLVQNDALNQHSQPRNPPIPYLQNHVHGENGVGGTLAPVLTRPKLANISGNRSSYLRLQGDETSPGPHGHTATICTVDESQSKSLKYKLSKLIRPKDLGLKFSQMVFGGKHKKSKNLNAMSSQGNGKKADSNKNVSHYTNSGLEASPVNRNISVGNTNTSAHLGTQVQMVNGVAVTQTCPNGGDHSNLSHQAGSSAVDLQGRLSATNVMRLAVLPTTSQGELPSPSLFPKSESSSAITDPNSEEDNAVPLQNLITSRPAKDFDFLHPVMVNQAYGLDSQGEMPGADLQGPTLVPSTSAFCNQETCVGLSTDLEAANTIFSDTALDRRSLSMSQNYPGTSSLCHTSASNSSDYQDTASDLVHTKLSSTLKDDLRPCSSGQTFHKVTPPHSKSLASTQSAQKPNTQLKKNSQNSAGQAAPSSPSASYCADLQNHHFTDTKGGNSIMHNVYMDNSLSKDQPSVHKSLRTSHHGSKASRLIPLVTRSLSQPQGRDRVECGLGKDGDMSCGGPSVLLHKQEKSSKKFPHSHSATDLLWQESHLLHSESHHRDQFSEKTYKGDTVWQETDLSKSATSLNMHRPQSLALKGHNYNLNRGRSVSSSSSTSSSSSSFLPPAIHSKINHCAATSMTKAPTKDGVRLDEVTPFTLVVPNVTLDKNSPLFQAPNNEVNKSSTVATVAPSVAVTSVRSNNSNNSSCSSAANSCVNISNNSSSVSTANGDTASNVSLGDKSCCQHADNLTNQMPNVGDSSTDNNCNTASSRRARMALKERSDSSEKIRRRIKTPVSFKKVRLSLYDDRLMTQSLFDVPPPSSQSHKDNNMSGQGDSNNNSGSPCQDLTSEGKGHRGGYYSGNSEHDVTDYYKMIKSDSDLVV